MAIIEEVASSQTKRQPPVTIEELSDTPPEAQYEPSTGEAVKSDTSLTAKLKSITSRLVPPDDDPSDPAFQSTAAGALRELGEVVASPEWDKLSREDQAAVYIPAIRLNSPSSSPSFSSSTPLVVPAPPDASSFALYLLQNPLRTTFSHPSLSAGTRARSRPHGGANAMDDLHDDSAWKTPGIDNALAWCASQFSASEVERHLSLLLPPTLTMMDDWQPVWRDRGARVLASWVEKVDPGELRRRGLDTLLLKSLTHSLSLHHDPPLTHVFPVTLTIAEHLDGEHKAQAYAEIVDRGLVAGWTYASSSAIAVLADIARNAEALISVLGVGFARWLKSTIPSLLAPLQHEPTPNRLELYAANLSTLLALLKTLRGTGRVDRWRGQILDVVARVWVQVNDYGYLDKEKATADTVLNLTRDVYAEVAAQCPSVQEREFAQLRALGPRFETLIA
ncbi:hypothetical protein CspeluHIS016_0901100 [Cutaneotrichosporon spelunceum]|uniref:Uncharacterized protein n=1 Tax=Cutaneotrichosporon spelunceum TaxID=1672016 RepID=A0AAD3TZS1_9TREE|nr:hypothetical protein CspeluHIS016_0901100 [Cutaneotrichosporon spelunceum]